MNIGIRGGMITVFIDKEDRVKNLHGLVRIHGGGDVGDVSKITIDELAESFVIFDCAASAAAADVEFKVWDAEGVLHIDQHQPGFCLIC